ncbi:MAG: HAMP domain-containing histidine kinase [Clostridia bacterium]|nr:HAMP domain-containing histidine kinase [Clostridia bacterium]
MNRKTIKWKIFKYNITVIIVMITLATVIFNIAVRMYIERDIFGQLSKIAARTEDTALRQGPDFFPPHDGGMPPPRPPRPRDKERNDPPNNNDPYRYYFMLDRSLREPLSVLNAEYILLDSSKNIINPSPHEYYNTSDDLLAKIISEIDKSTTLSNSTYLNFNLSGTEYIAILKPVSEKNSFGLGWIVIYSSIQKVNQLRLGINLILFAILILSAIVIIIFSSLAAKKISALFCSLNQHIRAVAERNFGTKIDIPVYDELQEFVNNINTMSEKLETYDKAQKTFLQNASHEFRTPLMSIQSYAEGIKYDVVDSDTAAGIIIDETKRMTHLVEDLLYLSRLDAIEENYCFNNLDFNDLLNICMERMNGLATKNNIKITANNLDEKVEICADKEKLSRAITNIISNCIRYAQSSIEITSKIINNNVQISISDDGPGLQSADLPNIFERFYKGKKGNFGLGLAITKNIIEKHNGKVWAENSESGAVFKIILPSSHA